MTQREFRDAVLEQLFVRGYECQNVNLLADYVLVEWNTIVASPDPCLFANRCVGFSGVTRIPERLGKNPSPTVGASERWLAVHEAGHGIVGLKSGLALRGIRFYGSDGFPGETGLEEFVWASSSNEAGMQRHIRVDVAANLAEMLLAVREPDGGRPSQFWDSRDPKMNWYCPSDIEDAWKCARRLAIVQFTKAGRPLDDGDVWRARRAIIEQGEAEAEQVLRDNRESLIWLADQLQLGPMTGTAVRAVLGL